jgi:predicted RecA/RadA family phage recombinase
MYVLPKSLLSSYVDTAPATSAGMPVLGDGSGSGRLYTHGDRFVIAGDPIDAKPLLAIDAAGALVGDEVKVLAAGESRVSLPADSGDLELVYVKNASGSPIGRGELCAIDALNGTYAIAQSGAGNAGSVLGVALFTIEDGKSAFIACGGVAPIVVSASIAQGAVLVPAGSGRVKVAAAVSDSNVGIMLDDASAASAGDVHNALIRL